MSFVLLDVAGLRHKSANSLVKYYCCCSVRFVILKFSELRITDLLPLI
jgi:hypothetical protein